MAKSTITSKNQTTVPRAIRERLGVGKGDVLLWEFSEGVLQVRPAQHAFLKRAGSIPSTVSSVEAVHRARLLRGTTSR